MFKSLLTRENITLAIALLGAVGTVSSWIYRFFSSRKKLDISLLKVFEPHKSLVVYVSFQNRSRLPISINTIGVVFGERVYQCEPVAHVVYSSEVNGRKVSEIRTMSFPVNLSPLSGSSGFVEFELPSDELKNLSTRLTLQVSSNRGNPTRTIFSLREWDDEATFL